MPSLTEKLSDITTGAMGAVTGKSITVGDYLLTKLKELGCDMIFGVPGDYNMEFLDQIEGCRFNAVATAYPTILNVFLDFKGIDWGYNTTELAAAYAADGYARVKGIGAICTTFAVGELRHDYPLLDERKLWKLTHWHHQCNKRACWILRRNDTSCPHVSPLLL